MVAYRSIRREAAILLVLLSDSLLTGGCHRAGEDGDTYTVFRNDYHAQKTDLNVLLPDDSLDSKTPEFDPDLIDRRPFHGYLVNSSAAVIKLDVPMLLPDRDADLLTLYPSYRAALIAAEEKRISPARVLPSVNLIDGQAKQFDDGLYAALDLAYYQGLNETLESHIELVQRIAEKAGPTSPASPFLAAALSLAGKDVETGDKAARDRLLKAFEASEVRSKPIGFYTWKPELKRCFRFLRFLQQPFSAQNLTVPRAIASVLKENADLLEAYQKVLAFYSRLTNPLDGRSVLDLIEDPSGENAPAPVAFLPASTSRETELFEKLFPRGLPADADLMHAFITRIRAGDVNLKPGPDSGWYDYQAYALETFLLPEKGRESEKLVLTSSYKKRMLEAFQALMTKRRETHSRQAKVAAGAEAPPMSDLSFEPRLRIEPSLTYYLRTARGYAFLAEFLEQAVGEQALRSLHGLTKDGPREKDLFTELREMRDLFYGFYLVGCEDIGLKPEFDDGEEVDREGCEALASGWLEAISTDPDLAVDTRVSTPIYVDPQRNITRLWVTLGVRLSRLDAHYLRPPSVKPAEGDGEWKTPETDQLKPLNSLIPVDEFAEVELRGNRVLNREELRAICDRYKTKAAIIKALQGP